ncbi:MAG: fumarate hydratase [Elusimicrobiota bacterium]
MRTINTGKVAAAVERLYGECNRGIGKKIYELLKRAALTEKGKLQKYIYSLMLENISIAKKDGVPLCQDTGFPVVFIDLGQGVRLTGGSIQAAVNTGLARAVKKYSLRESVINDPVVRNPLEKVKDWGAVHIEIVPGNKVKIALLVKGAGSENKSVACMLTPGGNIKEKVGKYVVDAVRFAGSSACPPVVVGVGLGGCLDTAAVLSKKALLRKVGSKNSKSVYAIMEKNIIREINKSGIGVHGFGGKVTALAVFIEQKPCHIASLPVAVSINCYLHRTGEVVL